MRTDSFVGESRSRSGSGTGARPGFGPDYHNAIAGQHPPGQDQGRSLRRTESNISITLKKRGYFGQLRRSPSFILFTVFLALFVDMATYGIIVPILPFIVSDKANGGATDTGLLLGVYSIGILMASPLFGVLGDYFVSRRVPMLIGLVVMLISTVLFMVANNFYVFLMARLLQGMAGGSVWTLGLALITDIFPAKTLGVQMGKALIGHTLGLMMGPPLGGILYERGGYRAPFFFVCAITLIDFVCRALIIEEREEIVKALREQGMQHEASEEEAEVVAMRRKERLEGSTSFWTLIKNKRLLGCVIVTACNGFAFSGAEPTVPLHLSSTFHLTSERIGLVFMAFSLPTLTAPISGALSDKFGAKVVCVVSLVLCAGAIIAGGLSQNSLPMIVSLFTIIGTTGIAILAPVLGELSAVVRTTGTGDGSARVYAMFNMAFSIGVLVGPVVCGIVYENFGFMYLSIAMASVLILAVPVALVCLGGLEQKKLDLALAKEEEEKRAATRDSLKRSKYNVEFDGESNEQEYHSDDDEVDSDGKTRVRWSPRATSMEKQLSDGQSDDGDASSQRALVGKGREPSAQILKSARMD
ncbi:major facilitator superfamily domain-containing protein [Mortierella sp. GBAus27b]|nr:major facilitator superfamily domain-containing protein [Mortierella sp. GBAus27b]